MHLTTPPKLCHILKFGGSYYGNWTLSDKNIIFDEGACGPQIQNPNGGCGMKNILQNKNIMCRNEREIWPQKISTHNP